MIRTLMQSPAAARTLINDRWRDYFSGTGYLGLQGHPALSQAALDALQRYGLTTGTSRGGYGEHPIYQAVEEAAAAFFDAERAAYFTSGYLGAAILLQGLRESYQIILVDDAAHSSIWSGARATGAAVTSFRHMQPDDLAEQLRLHLRPGERPLVIGDGVFPVSGEIAPVPAYVEALQAYAGAVLCLDDAHAAGVLGATGRGTLEHWNVDSQSVRVHAVHTLSKALGGFGGILAGSAELVEQLARRTAAFVGASPPPLPAAAASAAALALVRAEPERRNRLRANVARARAGLRQLGWSLEDSPVPILCLGKRPGIDLARLQAELFARDICVAHVTSYSSTPPGGALRIAVFATHSDEQIDRLITELATLIG
jgi:glycine C-acetyltransferase/8-amino-7-oxononanoate synthase